MLARGEAGAEAEAGPKRQSQRDTETKTHRDNESRRLWRDFFGSRFAAIAEALFIYVFFALFCIFCFWFFCLQIFYFFFLFCFFFFLVKRARVRWPLPVDRFVLSQSADVSPQQSKARSSFRAKYVRIHSTCIWPQLGNRPSIYPYCCWISFGSIYIYANYCAESCRTGWLTRQPLNCSTVQVLWLRLRLWLWLWRRISGLSVSWLQSSFVPYSSWLGWEILRH